MSEILTSILLSIQYSDVSGSNLFWMSMFAIAMVEFTDWIDRRWP